jgi:hypothetical protein
MKYPLGFVIGMADIVAGLAAFLTEITRVCHENSFPFVTIPAPMLPYARLF